MGQRVSGHHHQPCRFERAGPANRVERVLQVVSSSSNHGAGFTQRSHSSEPSRHRDMAATLQKQVGVGKCDDRNARLGNEFGNAALLSSRLHSEAHTVARSDGQFEPSQRQFGEIDQPEHVRVECFVGVEVHAETVLGGQVHQPLGRGSERPTLEVRNTADEIYPGLGCVPSKRALIGTRTAHQRPTDQRDNLDIDDVGNTPLHFHKRLDARQAVFNGGIGMTSNRRKTVAGHQSGRSLGTFDRFADGEQMTILPHCCDRAHQITGRVLNSLRQKRLVEMCMRFHRCWQKYVASEVGCLLSIGFDEVTNRGNDAVDDAHILFEV